MLKYFKFSGYVVVGEVGEVQARKRRNGSPQKNLLIEVMVYSGNMAVRMNRKFSNNNLVIYGLGNEVLRLRIYLQLTYVGNALGPD